MADCRPLINEEDALEVSSCNVSAGSCGWLDVSDDEPFRRGKWMRWNEYCGRYTLLKADGGATTTGKMRNKKRSLSQAKTGV